MRIIITCDGCGRRHSLERTVSDPGDLWVVCHGCEQPLLAVLDEATLVAHRDLPAQPVLRHPFATVWGTTFDLSVPTR